jgi:hypothetical protein
MASRPFAARKGQIGLIFSPVDEVESHAPLEHFRLKIRGMQLPFVSLADTEWEIAMFVCKNIVRG